MKNYLYLKSIWTHVAAFGDVFNDMSVLAYDSQGRAVGWKPVPITSGPKEKVMAALIADEPGKSPYSPDNYLPRMSYTWTGITRNQERQRGQREKRRLLVSYDDEGEPTVKTDMQTVPYDINFELVIWTKYIDDMAQILENILPFFNPEAHISLCERGLVRERQVKLNLDGMSQNFEVDLQDTDRRILQCTLNFTMEMNLYKPELPIEKPIRRVTVRLGADETWKVGPGVSETGFAAIAKGDEISTYLLPCVSGAEGDWAWLSLDKKIWSTIQAFDDNLEKYMTNQYHDELVPEAPITPYEDVTNPNYVENTYTYYGIPDADIIMGTEGYYFDIPEVSYNQQVFEPNGTTVVFSWTVSISADVVQDGVDGILYSGDPIYNYGTSGSYFVPNTAVPGYDLCEEIAEELECND